MGDSLWNENKSNESVMIRDGDEIINYQAPCDLIDWSQELIPNDR